MGPQRHFLVFMNPLGCIFSISIHSGHSGFVADDQLQAKGCALKVQWRRFLYHSPVLLPTTILQDWRLIDYVPPAACCAIRWITQHHVSTHSGSIVLSSRQSPHNVGLFISAPPTPTSYQSDACPFRRSRVSLRSCCLHSRSHTCRTSSGPL